MRTTIRTIAAMSAAILALVSCSKENLIGNGKKNFDGVRTITMSFSTSTRSALADDGVTPHFTDGDEIMLQDSDGKTEKVTVSVNEETATASTTLKGALTAVYPADAHSANEPYYTVSSTQDGTFAKANICTATIPDEANPSAMFENKTAILRFYVDESIGVKSITVTSSAANIADNSKTITVDPEGEATIDQVTDDPDARICYVAVLPGAATELTFSSVTTTQDSYTNNTVERTTSSIALSAGNMYNAFIPYYIKVKVSDSPETYQKWGYCNVGAFLPEEAGEYFMWGEVVGHKYVDGSWTNFPTVNPDTERYTGGWYAESGFRDCNTPYYDGSDYSGSKYNKGEGKKVLDLSDDAANANWGGSWRMPTEGEITALVDLDSNSSGWDNTDGHKGWIVPGTDSKLFFPATGCGDGTDLSYVGAETYYLASSLDTDNSTYACILLFGNGYVMPETNNRSYGYSVRALSN